jgi:hypothetical protein
LSLPKHLSRIVPRDSLASTESRIVSAARLKRLAC